ncbi:hypothetical protein JB92DRAFT_3140431 [Gautieria morchelliformis]|nr:hypothetical protein JB92DRAFT_3140431 [Gautieria morchelliformis]
MLFLALGTPTRGLLTLLNLGTVYDLPTTAPPAGDTFTAEGTTSVAWDTAALPASGSPSHNGTLVFKLGFVQSADSEHLDTGLSVTDARRYMRLTVQLTPTYRVEHPLASGFSFQAGAQSVVFPEDFNALSRRLYPLFGDSGNISQRFIIQAQPTH